MLLATFLGIGGCFAEGERGMRSQLDRAGELLAEIPTHREDPLGDDWDIEAPSFDGSPTAYVEYALAHDRGLRAGWERWRAATHRIARERRLPMPTITYSIFVSQIETRVGPQRHKLSVRQRFPWPGELSAGADAAAASARAMQREFEAQALDTQARVLTAYWRLWLVRETERTDREQLELLMSLAELARARLEVSRSTLADILQLELELARLDDDIEGLGEREREAVAVLLAATGAPPDTGAPTLREPPVLAVPREGEEVLRAALVEHPHLDQWQQRVQASGHRVREARNARAPGFAVGVDWIEVGPAPVANMAGSGRDAVAVSVGLELPLWQRSYAEDQRAAEADAAAAQARWFATRDAAAADLSVALAEVRDTARRASVREYTLIPQAEGALESVLGGYAAGEADLAVILFAERELLALSLELDGFRARHAAGWAELERIVGRPVAPEPVDTRETP